jgi:hypothetical protein
VAGGDVSGKLGGAVNLATSTNSTASALVFDTSSNTFVLVTSLNTKRESSAPAVALPNGLTLIAGGQTCGPRTYSGTAGFQCDALQTAELYHEDTKSFTIAGSGSGNLMTIARSGPSATIIEGSGTGLDGQVLIVGGSTGSSFLSTASTPPAGSPPGQVALHTAELYNPATDTFTATTNAIPSCAPGTFPPACTNGLAAVCPGPTSAIMSASDSGGTVTITMTTANPTGLIMGDNVTIAGVSVAGYNGTFVVTAIPTGSTFQYTAASGLVGGTGGTAAADTSECGMVDQGAALIPNDSGKVLLAAGDLLQFLGQSSNVSFIFDPATQTFARTTGSLATPRELFPLVALPNPPVTGALSGKVVAFGGVEANSVVACANTPTTPVVVTTLNSAEVFDPSSQTWSATANTMGAKRAAVATLIDMGTKSGMVIIPGGVDVEAGTFPSTCAATLGIKQSATKEVDLYDPGTGVGGTFTATGSLNQAREGAGQGVLGTGTDMTDVLVIGGACTTTIPSLQSFVIGTAGAAATNACNSAGATSDYSELYSQSGGTWGVGPANPASPTAVSIMGTTESGSNVTVTMTTANPVGLVIGGAVVIAAVTSTPVGAYNGTFIVTAIPTSNTFQYTDTVSGAGAGTGGNAVAVDGANAAASAVLP